MYISSLYDNISNVSIDKVRSFATDLVRGLSSCLGQLPSCRAGNLSQNSCLPASTSCLATNHPSSQLPAGLNCLASSQSQLLCAVKTKLAVQFSRQLLRRTTVNHLVTNIHIKTIQIIMKHIIHHHEDNHQVGALSPMMLATTGRRLQVFPG